MYFGLPSNQFTPALYMTQGSATILIPSCADRKNKRIVRNIGLMIRSDLSLMQYLRLTVCGEWSGHSWSDLSLGEFCFGPRFRNS